MLKTSSWVTDERLSSFHVGNLLFPSSLHFKIHATDSSHKQYFAFVPSGIDTTSEIDKERGPNASRLKTGKSTGGKNVLMKKERECMFLFICLHFYLTETTMCQKPRSRNWAIVTTKKKKKRVAFKAALSLKRKGSFSHSAGETKTAHLGQSWGVSEMVSGLIFLPLTQHYTQLICPCPEVERDLKDSLILSCYEDFPPWRAWHTNGKIKPLLFWVWNLS